jgi:hypothetical protein
MRASETARMARSIENDFLRRVFAKGFKRNTGHRWNSRPLQVVSPSVHFLYKYSLSFSLGHFDTVYMYQCCGSVDISVGSGSMEL